MKSSLISLFGIAVLLFGGGQTAFAATFSFHTDPALVGTGDTVLATLSIDSDEPVNALSGTLMYSSDVLEPLSVSDGNSIISIWLTHPSVINGTAAIPFTGLIPGGYAGRGGIAFAVLFRARAAGSAQVTLSETEVFRADGVATKEPVSVTPHTFSIGMKSVGGYVEPTDINPPESFTVEIGQDADLFDGGFYGAFDTVDKGSGIDHYEIRETRLPFAFGAWQPTERLVRVSDQYRTSDVYVRAIDRTGNVRVAKASRAHLLRPHETITLLSILFGLMVWWYTRSRRPLATL